MGGGRKLGNVIRSICTCGDSGTETAGSLGPMCSNGVKLEMNNSHVVIDNGIFRVQFSKPAGIVTGIRYNGIDNLLEPLNNENNRGYWDIVWNALDGSGTTGAFEVIKGTQFKVIMETEEQVELSFSRPWDPSLTGKVAPLNIDKRFIVLRGSSGFYSYAICEHVGSPEWQAFSLGEIRITFKLRKDKFRYMAVADDRQRFMPLPDDRMAGRCQPLGYPEAVLLVNPVDPALKGEVDDKYQYSCQNKDLKVHGWISMEPRVGFWQITPSDEFRTGGPLKQSLTSHVGPTCLSIFHSSHYCGAPLVPKFEQGEAWKKVFGPVFIYLNSSAAGYDPRTLWEDAKRQMMVEVQSWPYSFPASEDFLKSDKRGIITGRLLVKDRYICSNTMPANWAHVGLVPPGDVGSWQTECKDYQFWTRTDENGYFSIRNILPGNYNLYGWAPGIIGDYRRDGVVTITPGCCTDMGDLVYEPPRYGPPLWEIGIPDRSAAEFHVPDPDPQYVNRLFINHPDRFRQYGLWDRYAELYPDGDLIYTIGVSDYRKDWFYAQVNRRNNDNTFQGTTWQIRFSLLEMYIHPTKTYKLRIALASATYAELQVRVNDPNTKRPLFSSGLIGRDNAVARHGIHGLYWLFEVNIPSGVIVPGNNTIYLTQPRNQSSWQYLMYDYIRLEGPCD